MLKRLIIFLIRRKLGVKNKQPFRFVGQKSHTDFYYFKNGVLWKAKIGRSGRVSYLNPSDVSLFWITNDDCKVVIVKDNLPEDF